MMHIADNTFYATCSAMFVNENYAKYAPRMKLDQPRTAFWLKVQGGVSSVTTARDVDLLFTKQSYFPVNACFVVVR